jgi:predicted amidophosphoribosyltransferase
VADRAGAARWRIWARGYNQSALLAGTARLTGATLVVDALVRRRIRRLWARWAGRAGEGGRGCHHAPSAPCGWIEGLRVLLVDDVLTTGATTNACIEALAAREVKIACFARVMGAIPEAAAEDKRQMSRRQMSNESARGLIRALA